MNIRDRISPPNTKVNGKKIHPDEISEFQKKT